MKGVNMSKKSNKDLGELIQRALTYGINLGDMSREEELEYMLNLSDFINKAGSFTSVYDDTKLTIETKYMEPLVMVRVRKNTLEFLPLSDSSFFDSFMSILEFISFKKKEEDLMKEFKIFIDEVDKDLLNDELVSEEEIVEQPPAKKEDDFDWI